MRVLTARASRLQAFLALQSRVKVASSVKVAVAGVPVTASLPPPSPANPFAQTLSAAPQTQARQCMHAATLVVQLQEGS